MRNFISAKRHVTCETVNKSFWQNRAENWESRVTFFLPVKRAETFKDKTHTAGDGIMPSPVFLWIKGAASMRRRLNGPEAQKRAPIYEVIRSVLERKG